MRRVSEAVAPSNISEALQKGQHRVLDSVVEKTGPAPFTDAVLRCTYRRLFSPLLPGMYTEGTFFSFSF